MPNRRMFLKSAVMSAPAAMLGNPGLLAQADAPHSEKAPTELDSSGYKNIKSSDAGDLLRPRLRCHDRAHGLAWRSPWRSGI